MDRLSKMMTLIPTNDMKISSNNSQESLIFVIDSIDRHRQV